MMNHRNKAINASLALFALFLLDVLGTRRATTNQQHLLTNEFVTRKPPQQHTAEKSQHQSSGQPQSTAWRAKRNQEAAAWPNLIPFGEEVRIMLMHVGKAGGQGLRSTLHLGGSRKIIDGRQACWKKAQQRNINKMQLSLQDAWNLSNCERAIVNSDTLLSQHIFAECHTRWCEKQSYLEFANTFLFELRHPISRLESAYRFCRTRTIDNHRSTNRVFQHLRWVQRTIGQCFPDMESASQGLLSHGLMNRMDLRDVLGADVDEKDNNVLQLPCSVVAQSFLLGMTPDVPYCRHFHFGYRHYQELANQRPEIPIIVARQEHQLEDLRKLDQALGGNGTFPVAFLNQARQKRLNDTIQTLEGKQLFCCLLWDDIQAYQDTLLKAANLDIDEKKEALFGAFEECSVPYDQNEGDRVFDFSWDAWQKKTCAGYYKSLKGKS